MNYQRDDAYGERAAVLWTQAAAWVGVLPAMWLIAWNVVDLLGRGGRDADIWVAALVRTGAMVLPVGYFVILQKAARRIRDARRVESSVVSWAAMPFTFALLLIGTMAGGWFILWVCGEADREKVTGVIAGVVSAYCAAALYVNWRMQRAYEYYREQVERMERGEEM